MNLQNTAGGRLSSASETRGEGGRNKLPGARQPGRERGARLCCLRFRLSRYCHYMSVAQISPFRPSTSHSANESVVQRFLVRPLLLGGPKTLFFSGARIRSQRPCGFFF
jgi:hypothetical protein